VGGFLQSSIVTNSIGLSRKVSEMFNISGLWPRPVWVTCRHHCTKTLRTRMQKSIQYCKRRGLIVSTDRYDTLL